MLPILFPLVPNVKRIAPPNNIATPTNGAWSPVAGILEVLVPGFPVGCSGFSSGTGSGLVTIQNSYKF